MNNYKKITLSLLLIPFMLLGACSDDNTGMATLKVGLTDAPGDYEQVNIEIHQVLVKRSDSEATDATEGEDDESLEEAGWEVVLNDTLMVNLLDYQNGVTLDLGEVSLEPGQYNQMRLVLGDDNNIVLASGVTVALTTPSGQSSGLKLNINADISDGDVYELIIDFDAARSVVVRGNGSYNLKPVIRVIQPESNGSISGVISPIEAMPVIYAVADGDTLSSMPDDAGSFSIIGLDENDYVLSIEPSNEAYADSVITISLGEDEDFVITETIVLTSNN